MKNRSKAKESVSPVMVVSAIIGILLSIGLMYLMGTIISNDFSAFRSCSINNGGLTSMNCGKQALNSGDYILLTLGILSVALFITLCTAVWRMVRGSKT